MFSGVFNLTEPICEAIAYNPKTFFKIDEIFNSNKQYYLEIIKKHEQEITKYCIYSLKQDDYVRKFLSILFSDDSESMNNILSIFKHGWGYVYKYVETSNNISINSFLEKFIKKNKNFTNYQINSSIYVLLFLSLNLNKKITDLANNEIIRTIWLYYKDKDSLKFTKEKFYYNNKNKELVKTIRENLFKKINLKKFDLDALVNNENFREYINKYGYIYNYENIDSYICFDLAFSEEDIDDLIAYFLVIESNGILEYDKFKIDYDKLTKFVFDNFILKVFIKAFKVSKDYYIKNNQELFLYDMIKINNKLNIIEDYNNKLVKENENLLKALKEKEAELERQKREYEDYKKELVELRNFIFNMEKIKEEEVIEEKIETINNNDILIVGGHKWIENFKKYIPNAIIITDENINFDTKIFEKIKYVLVYTKHMSHSLYYKVISNIKHKDINLIFLPYQNIEKNMMYIQNMFTFKQ